jgi:VIT1/CCC1 family predicted Fe2+/Mn2+ transporter
MAGASASHHNVVLAGVAGLLAGACSMGSGEYISVRSQREVFEYQIEIEKQELAEYPEEEMKELSLIYQARGIPEDEANKLSALMINNPETALNTLAREELGINPEDMVSPVGAMLSSFFSFAFGALVPLIPFVLSDANWTLPASIIATAVSLFLIGAMLSLYANKNPLWLGFRMTMIGVISGGITYFIGNIVERLL